jgi:hypothetical protein
MSEHGPDARTGRDEPPIDGGSPTHARIDELLAGHALHALDGEDLREAERILTEHLPTCGRCRNTVEQFRAITADLALGSRPANPPEVLLPRLRRETLAVPVDERPAEPQRPRRAVGSWISAAAALVLVGLVLWNAFLHVRLQGVTARQKDITRVTHFMAQPDAETVALESAHPVSRVLMGFREAQVALFGSDIPDPGDGNVYRLWIGHGNRVAWVGDFRPENGVVAVLLEFDARQSDQIFVTEESGADPPTTPDGQRVWSASLGGGSGAAASDQSA